MEEKKDLPYRQKGLVRFGLKMLFYTSLTLATLGFLDYYNIPSRMLQGWKESKEKVIQYVGGKPEEQLPLEQRCLQLPDSTMEVILQQYLPHHPQLTKQLVLTYTQQSALSRLPFSREEKVDLIGRVYATLDKSGKWEVTKRITKETFGF